MRTLTRTLLIAPLLAAATLAVGADKPKKEATLGAAKATGPYLTREELRACLNRQVKVKEEDAAVRNEENELTAMKEGIVRSGDALKLTLDALDRGNAEAVDNYNAAVRSREQKIEEFEKRANSFNARTEANRAERQAFGGGCSNRRYFEEDEIAIKKGK